MADAGTGELTRAYFNQASSLRRFLISVTRIRLYAYWIAMCLGLICTATTATNTSSTSLDPSIPPPLPHDCSHPLPPAEYNAFIDSTIPADLDPNLITPPTATTRIFFSVLVPEHCPDEHYPVVFNQAAWGTRRIEHLAASPALTPQWPEAASVLQLLRQMPYYGYVVISVDPRGIGDSILENGGGPQRLMDPNAEVQDARQILDWAYDNADAYAIQTEPNSGIAKDLKLGLLGVSYGAGYEPTLAALDARVDALVPVMTWNDLMYSIIPGGAAKLGWNGTLCSLGQLVSQEYTPTLAELCQVIGVTNPLSGKVRGLQTMFNFLGIAPGQFPPPPVQERQQRLKSAFGTSALPTPADFIRFLEYPGAGYLASQQNDGKPWAFAGLNAPMRPVPALFVQGNSDLLFNLTEGYWNWRYFSNAGGDTRLMSTNGGHNAMAVGKTGYCGSLNVLDATLAWFDHYLHSIHTSEFDLIPKVCLSVSDTVGAPRVANIAVQLSDFPKGSLSGTGAIPAQAAKVQASIGPFQNSPSFVPITTIQVDHAVLAGVPSVASLSVSRGTGALPETEVVALIGTGILRDGQLITVDQQVTAFAEGVHTRTDQYLHQEDQILLPAIGEQLRVGDQVGLLFFPQHYNYTALLSPQAIVDDPALLNQILGTSGEWFDRPTVDNLVELAYINPYSVQMTDVELPIFIPGQYLDSRLVAEN